MAGQRTIIVTGASRGIGHATALRFHAEGWRVITVSRNPPPGQCPWSVANSHILLDLSDLDDIARCVEVIRGMLIDGTLHALVNNAGVSPKAEDGSRLNSIETDIGTWQSMYNTNFYAPLLLTRGFVAELARAKGAVVNLTSIAGTRVHPFAGSAYATSKAALAALTREMAFDLASVGIRVNAIAPGEIDTAILSPAPRRSSTATSRCAGSGRSRKSRTSSGSSARRRRLTLPAPRSRSTEGPPPARGGGTARREPGVRQGRWRAPAGGSEGGRPRGGRRPTTDAEPIVPSSESARPTMASPASSTSSISISCAASS